MQLEIYVCLMVLLIQVVQYVHCAQVTPLTVANPNNILKTKLQSHTTVNNELFSAVNNFNIEHMTKLLRNGLQSSPSNVSDDCIVSFLQLANDILLSIEQHQLMQSYAVKVFDAWGKLESGILEGNVAWPGRYYECENIKHGNFTGNYCSMYVGTPVQAVAFGIGTPTGVTVGGCFPDKCNNSELYQIFQPLAQSHNLTVQVNCPNVSVTWGFKEGIGLFVCIALALCVIASTTYDYMSQLKSNSLKLEFSDTNTLLNPDENKEQPQGKLHKLAISFSVITNTRILLNTDQKPGQINCLHGMRFLSMSWVMLGHSFLFSVSYSDNIMFSARYFIEHWDFQAVANATVSVDSFFYLSGLLIAYLGMKEINRRDGKMNVPLMYLHRYLRLTPAYAFCILLCVSIYPMLGDGPNWPAITVALSESCQKSWWSNLLYFNNLYPANMAEECYGWGWYLANDTQFYLLAPLFLYALYKIPAVGIALVSIFATASIAVTGGFSAHTNQQPQVIDIGALAYYMANSPFVHPHSNGTNNTVFDADPASQYSPYMFDLYTKPWCRIGAWLVGLLTGYLLHVNNNKIKMPKVVVALGWIAAVALNCSILYGLFPTIRDGSLLNNNTAAFYNAMFRPLWCVGLAWVTVACVSGYGGPVNTFLSWKAFIPLSRLTYCTYLVHPLVIWWFLGTEEIKYHYSIHFIMLLFLACLVVAILMAYIVSMLIEAPIIAVVKTAFGKTEKQPIPPITHYSNGNGNLPSNQDGFLINAGNEHDG